MEDYRLINFFMSKKIIISTVIIGIIAMVAVIALNNAEVSQIAPENKEQTIREFTVESFVGFVDGNSKPQFSLKEITVNKGDLVRLKITATSGRHDFKLDEFGVFADTPLNQETMVEFTADKAGEFIYYCNQSGHRANGQWGTLKVLE